jgi:hypothetical protein
MSENIAVPAEVVRQMATEASENVLVHRREGRKATAQYLQKHISEAFEAASGKDGEFVSISGRAVSSLAAETCTEVPSYFKTAEIFLEQYDVW